MKIQEITFDSANYPDRLRFIATAPKILYVLGDLETCLGQPCLAVIGSRKVTAYGKAITLKLAKEAAEQGITIISGLALGADGLAHQAALEGGGRTVGVLPSGLDKIYPSTHRQLAKQILERGGALVTEYPFETEAFKTNFVARNRIVSGLSDGVLVTEAAERSGTMHTAGFALEQGRTVMAVPGNITSYLSAGTNNLIKTGAAPVTSIQDILDALDLKKVSAASNYIAANEQEAILLSLLQEGISEAGELQTRSKLSTSLFNQTLTMLEITGKIRPLGAGNWAIN